MKKLSIIFIILSFLFVNHAYACGENVHKITTTIDNVEYKSVANEFLFNTTPDSEGGFWTIQIDKEELETY